MIRSTRTLWRSLQLALAAFGLGACAVDTATAPLPTGASPLLLADLFVKQPLERKVVLDGDVSVSAIIGKDGGRIVLPDQGFTLVVPRHAVRKNTRFTVTAISGKLVAYEFEPHGTKFGARLSAIQDLGKTEFRFELLPSLTAGYFADRSQLLQRDGTVLLNELIYGSTSLLTREFKWPIEHFSGYIVAF